MEAFHVLVPYTPRNSKVAAADAAYRYCVTAREKQNGDVVLFEPARCTTYTVPKAHLRRPTALPRELEPKRLARLLKRTIKSFKQQGRRHDRTTAMAVLAQLEQMQ